MCIIVLFEAGRGSSTDPAEERLGGTKLDFAEQIGREDLDPREKPDASRTQAFQAEHLSTLCQIKMVAQTLETRQRVG